MQAVITRVYNYWHSAPATQEVSSFVDNMDFQAPAFKMIKAEDVEINTGVGGCATEGTLKVCIEMNGDRKLISKDIR